TLCLALSHEGGTSMKRLVICVALVAAAGTLGPVAFADRHKHGPDVHSHPGKMRSSVRHFHTTRTGHKLYSHISGGKIQTVRAHDRKGKQLPVKKVRTTRRIGGVDPGRGTDVLVSAGELGLEGGEVVAATVVPGSEGETALAQPAMVFIGFAFWD